MTLFTADFLFAQSFYSLATGSHSKLGHRGIWDDEQQKWLPGIRLWNDQVGRKAAAAKNGKYHICMAFKLKSRPQFEGCDS